MTADPETVRREKAQAERVAASLIQSHKAALNRYDELVELASHAYLLGLTEGLRASLHTLRDRAADGGEAA